MRVIINGYESHEDNSTGRTDIQFVSCKEKECDLFITLDTLEMNKAVKVNCKEMWCMPYEPPVPCYHYFTETYDCFDLINTQWQNLSAGVMEKVVRDKYHILPLTGIELQELRNLDIDKIRSAKEDKVSAIISFAHNLPGHKFRSKFVSYLKEQKFDFIHYGTGYNWIPRKADALLSYKYSIGMENSSFPFYCTEKIGDCFACLTMPIYWGCPNITEYFPAESMILIDENDFQGSLERINEAIANDHYNKYFDAIVAARDLVLSEYSIYPYLCSMIDKYYPTNPEAELSLRSFPARIPHKQRTILYKLKKKLGIYALKDRYRKRNWYKSLD